MRCESTSPQRPGSPEAGSNAGRRFVRGGGLPYDRPHWMECSDDRARRHHHSRPARPRAAGRDRRSRDDVRVAARRARPALGLGRHARPPDRAEHRRRRPPSGRARRGVVDGVDRRRSPRGISRRGTAGGARGAPGAASRATLRQDARGDADGARAGCRPRRCDRRRSRPLLAQAVQPSRARLHRRAASERARVSAGSRSSFPVRRLTAVFALLSIAPLALLTYFSLTLATHAVHREVETRMSSDASMSAEVVREDMEGLKQLVASYARRPSLISSLADGVRTPEERAFVRVTLRDLRRARRGIPSAGLIAPDGRLIEVVPATPSIIGKDFSFRDWFKGVTRTGRPYVSEAFRSKATGQPMVVSAATLVRDAHGRVLGILVAGYTLEHIQRFVDQLAVAQHVKLRVTDQRGNLVVVPGGVPKRLLSPRSDPRVAAALEGRKGIVELDTPDGRRLSAYMPVTGIGWTITASVPANTAFAAVEALRWAVLAIAGMLGLVLLGGLTLLLRTLRGRRRAEVEAARLTNINRAVLDATPDAIFMLDRAGRLLVKNAALDRLHENGAEQPSDADVYEGLRAAADELTDPEAFRRTLDAVAADPECVAAHDLERAEDGRAFRLYSAPVRDTSAELVGRIFVMHERTAEIEAERLKSDLVATVSHELRTPLASILGFAELLVDRDVDEATHERYLATIHGEAKRLTTLINDFLDLQRIEEGGFTLTLDQFDLEEVLREQVELFTGQSER